MDLLLDLLVILIVVLDREGLSVDTIIKLGLLSFCSAALVSGLNSTAVAFKLVFLGLNSTAVAFKLVFLGLKAVAVTFKVLFLGLNSTAVAFKLVFLGLNSTAVAFKLLFLGLNSVAVAFKVFFSNIFKKSLNCSNFFLWLRYDLRLRVDISFKCDVLNSTIERYFFKTLLRSDGVNALIISTIEVLSRNVTTPNTKL